MLLVNKFLIVTLVLTLGIFSQVNAESKTKLKLSTRELVQRAVENSPDIKNTAFELVKADSGFLKSQSKYSWRLVGDADYNQSVLPDNLNNLFTGTRSQTNKYAAGIERVFQTGTYFKTEVSSTRFDNNAFEDPVKNYLNGFGTFRALGIPPLYTSAVTAIISQDLLKNTFGVQDRNIQQILKNQSEIAKLDLSLKLSNTIVDSLVTYWSYIVADSTVKTYEQLQKNTKNIRDLTKQKTTLGLSENFEVNQWNALLSQTESQLERVRLEKEESKRKLIRLLNLPPDTELDEEGDLTETLPKEMNYDKDLDYAFANRGDWRSIALKKEIAEKTMENARDNSLPSVKATVSRSAKSQNFISPQYGFTDMQNGVPTTKYFDQTANLKVTYPLFDKGNFAESRDARILKQQVLFQEDDLKKEITDDVKIKYDTVQVSHRILQNSIEGKKESEKYYNGLYNSFRLGRFNAVAVKNALDSFVQSELTLTQSRINYNINLMRYEIAKNSLLKKFEIDVDKIIPNY
ncbi:MAG: TolC family protein [Leptospiraceae bacterium]|nr:TolC family protein [Leptospiraceae bacterium]